MRITIGCILCLAFTCSITCQTNVLQKGFVYVKDVVPGLQYDIRYAGKNNFLGRPVKGYESAEAIASTQAAQALKLIQSELKTKGFGLKIFDAYRPQRAVNDFIAWAKILSDTTMKRQYYPDVPKSELFKRGYIASKSGHSRGSTVDLTLVDLKSGKELDMGSPYDFFGEISSHDTRQITTAQKQNRAMLRTIMVKQGFNAYDVEWWHYTLKGEPYPDTYFDFPVRGK